jgi:hypothetical protein
VRAKLLSTPQDMMAIVHIDPSYALMRGVPVDELGVKVQEVNITQMRPLEYGTGIADYGEEATSPTEILMMDLLSKTQDLAHLRELRDILIAQHPDEEEAIEDLYDDARMRLKDYRG